MLDVALDLIERPRRTCRVGSGRVRTLLSVCQGAGMKESSMNSPLMYPERALNGRDHLRASTASFSSGIPSAVIEEFVATVRKFVFGLPSRNHDGHAQLQLAHRQADSSFVASVAFLLAWECRQVPPPASDRQPRARFRTEGRVALGEILEGWL